jgi:peptidoglycan/xylan/chitin deacetylase (PgdA/CDA1 family)
MRIEPRHVDDPAVAVSFLSQDEGRQGRAAPPAEPPTEPRQLAPRIWRPAPLVAVSATVHAAAVVALTAAPRHWPFAAAALLGNHGVLAAAGMWPRSRLLGPNLSRLDAAAARRGEVALTFDDGPDPRVTPAVLDLLEERGARASFFFIGCRARQHPELVTEVARRGHRVENHSYSHSYAFAFFLPAALGRDIDRAQQVLADATGVPPRHFRAPAGIRSLLLERELASRGLALTSWTRRGFDTVSRDPVAIAGRLLRGLAAGDVLLLHDGSAARDRRGMPVVLEVLPRVLDALAERGLRGVPLPAAGAAR